MNWIKSMNPSRWSGFLLIIVAAAFGLWLVVMLPGHSIRKYLILALWTADFAGFLLGYLLVRSHLSLKTLLIQGVLLLLFLEAGLSLYDRLYRSRNNTIALSASRASLTGWETKPNQQLRSFKKGYGDVHYSTTRDGFRLFGDINSSKTKILVIGDSFTQANVISDGGTYYDYLKKQNPDIEIFAYGSIGYGSLQEYLILDRYLDIIQPDLIVWQFCFNDLVNNTPELQAITHANAAQMVQPFYVNRQIVLFYPGPLGFLAKHSKLIRVLDSQWSILANSLFGTVEDELDSDHPLLQKATRNTAEIMGLVARRIGNTPMVAFSAVTGERFDSIYAQICRKYAIHYVSGVQQSVEQAKKAGIKVDDAPYDNHWTEAGHAIAGRRILDFLEANRLLKQRKTAPQRI